jgi:photosynthetic reaction center cytochrome c subunit
MKTPVIIALCLGAAATLGLAFTFERPIPDTVQRGFRGTGMVQVYNPRVIAKNASLNEAPPAQDAQDPSGQKSSEVYENVKVLGDLDSNEFLRLMAAITEWVSPEQGCAYCHVEEGLASDKLYTKVVARRMLQMTQHINNDWTTHVGQTGVTCYTCHRGNPVPKNIWFIDPKQDRVGMGGKAGQNAASTKVALTSLPNDPFTRYLLNAEEIRVTGPTALPTGNRHSIKQAEGTFGLMTHLSQSLGVNCTYCHNSRAFNEWDGGPPQRATAWYGIRMARDLNNDYLTPLGPTYPAQRLGPSGDAPKANCTTCHQGAFKPLYGAQMLKDYKGLGGHPPIKSASVTQQ